MFAYKMVDGTDTRGYQYTELEGSTSKRCRESGEGRRWKRQVVMRAVLVWKKTYFRRIKWTIPSVGHWEKMGHCLWWDAGRSFIVTESARSGSAESMSVVPQGKWCEILWWWNLLGQFPPAIPMIQNGRHEWQGLTSLYVRLLEEKKRERKRKIFLNFLWFLQVNELK